jgi:hypothetical protein
VLTEGYEKKEKNKLQANIPDRLNYSYQSSNVTYGINRCLFRDP